ncbi:MAG: hypothetical protein ACHQ53_13975 [Polyangiales bacterium]
MLALLAAAEPEWNFDCIAYAATARAWLGESSPTRHARVYADLAAIAPTKVQVDIGQGSEYRRSIAADHRKLTAQLPFYANKPLYIGLVALQVAFGINSIAATFIVSALAYGLLAVAFLGCWTRITDRPLVWVVAGCVLLAPPIREVGQLATPDALAAALAFVGLSLLALRERFVLGTGLMLASILARPDSVLLVLAVLVWSAWSKRADRRTIVMAASASVATLVVMSSAIPTYPWATLVHHTFVAPMADPRSASVSVQPLRYLTILGRGLRGDFVLHRSFAPLFLVLTIGAWIWPTRETRPSPHLRLQAVLWAAISLHFLAFPMLADRFFVAHYLGMVVLTVSAGRSPGRSGANEGSLQSS